MSSRGRALLQALALAALAPAAAGEVFAGIGVGAIPDGGAGTAPVYGAPLVISFPVSGLTANVATVSVDVNLVHTWMGDVDMVLAAPGGTPSRVLVSRVGVTTAGSFGDSSNFVGTYLFTDSATGTNIWTVAATGCDSDCNVQAGSYRTTAGGFTGQTNPAPLTSLNATFGGLTPAQANGVWTLTLRDAFQSVVGSVSAAGLSINAAPFVISEFRLRGPNGANDEFIEVQNNTAVALSVAASSGTGFGLAASDGVLRCTIPNGTVLLARRHYLCVNSVGYSLASYPAGNGTTATADATYTTDIPDNAGIALFNTNVPANLTLANRLDAVGSTSEVNTLYKEGSGYPALMPFSINYAFVRDACGKGGSIPTFGSCVSDGRLIDTGSNGADFVFVDTDGTNAGAGRRLGAPGPENLASPGAGASAGPFGAALLDSCGLSNGTPNVARDLTSDPPNNSLFGTLDVRRTFTNNSGATVSRLRFRIVDLTTFSAPFGSADLRPRTASAASVLVDRPPCGSTSTITVQGTTLEQPPSQPNGGGFNSTLSAGTVTLGTPMPHGTSRDLRFLFGVQQTGRYKLAMLVEALPAGGVALFEVSGCTDACLAKGDFNLDGSPDVVFRNVANGAQNKVWFMNGPARVGEAAITPDASSADWLIRGTDDFSSAASPGSGQDGETDLVFWNQLTGNVEFWLMNGPNRVGSPVALTGGVVLPVNWDLSATADFNKDGKPDIVWRNFTSQQIDIWTMNGTAKTGNITPSPSQAVNANWIVVAAADYNDDGHTDFLWYNFSSGKIVTWYMNTAVVRTSGQFTTPDAAGDANWKVVGSSDYSGESVPATPPLRSPDIVWRNETSGNQVIWHLDFFSKRVHGEFTVPSANTPALDWRIVGPR